MPIQQCHHQVLPQALQGVHQVCHDGHYPDQVHNISLQVVTHQAGLLSLYSVLSAYAQLQVGNDVLKEAIIDDVKLSVVE